MRYLDALQSVPSTLGYGLRQKLREGYTSADLRADVMAALVVGVVALPLSMALAIASGVAPQHGLYTAIVAGIVCALLGGTRCQVTGPTAAFVVILVPIVTRFGLGGLLLAGLMAGFILLAMGTLKMGQLISFIPHPVTTGFTAGIAVVIGTIQLKDFLGLRFENPEAYVDRWTSMWHARGTLNLWEVAVGALTLALLVLLPRVIKKVPAPLLALMLAAVAVALATRFVPGFHVATIGTRFHSMVGGLEVAGIPPLPPMPMAPWRLPGPDGQPIGLSFHLFRELLPSAFAIAMLGAIESLLAAVVADAMGGTRHDPNAELIALGFGNILCPLFGGIAATGAIARTATNIRSGARSPLAAVIHGLFILACTVVLAPLVAYLPMAALAGLLLVVAKNMAEARHFAHIVKVAPKSDVAVLVICFLLTVFFDMVLAVGVGVVLASLMFMRRMAALAEVKVSDSGVLEHFAPPPGVQIYEIAGPLFFGAAQKAMSVFETIHDRTQVLILYLAQVPVIDATGLVALETLINRSRQGGVKLILAGLNKQPAEALEKAQIKRDPGRLAIAPDLESALSMAILHTARNSSDASQRQAIA